MKTVFFIFACLGFIPCAAADEGIIHVAPAAEALPDPGTKLSLIVKSAHADKVPLLLRTIVVSDGVLSEYTSTKATVDDYDQPVYLVDLPAPFAELSYQFVLYFPDKTTSSSPRYIVRRPCIPRYDWSALAQAPDSTPGEKAKKMLEVSQALETENKQLEYSLSLADKIIKALPES